MNQSLTQTIIHHIYSSLLIIPSNFIDPLANKSLKDNKFLLNKTLKFEDNGQPINNQIWGCQMSTNTQELKILCGDCSLESYMPEYCLIVQLKDAPAYGIYSSFDKDYQLVQNSMIAFTLNKQDWMDCSTYLQATFLAGMEQIKDIGLSWNKCENFQEQYDLMVSFIKHHDSIFGDKE